MLDQALEFIPENAEWPRDLYRLLIDIAKGDPLRIVLWTESDRPVGLVAFRSSGVVWEPVTQWIVPGFVGAVEPGIVGQLLGGLPFRARVAWWRMPEPPPRGGNVRAQSAEPTYGLPPGADFEEYWRSSGLLKNVKRARKRCERLHFHVNEPGSSEWVIRGSEEHWNSAGSTQLACRLEVARFLAAQGKYLSVTLKDGDRCIAGCTTIIHGRYVVANIMFRDRDPAYEKDGVGNYLMDVLFHQVRQLERGIDLGGSHAYKHRWAPQMGEKANIDISPRLAFIGDRIASRVSRLKRALIPRR